MSSNTAAPAAAPTAPTTSPAAVPERPALAPAIELSGRMPETGFARQQWLIQRDGRFIQVTELLYRIAEHADGARTLAEIARDVSAAIDRAVSADNVRHLLAAKLIPLGIVARADGSVETPAGTQPRSPLALNLRMAMLGPRFIDPVARVLQYLYVPPVLVALLLVAAAAQGWLFVAHGLAGGIHQALYTPGLLPALLAIIILSTAFHEFGHAAALRYGGGRVRGMGAGLYLIYPAFYTDVTDNYRLGRWARVRTDLGGFYFNLLFTIGVVALYFVTGWEFLLVVVLLIDLDIVHQLLPFVRLDGYWALADLTGLPDFFSQIGPFLRTVLPLPAWRGRRLPDLKGWVKAVFALYILITVPLLVFLLGVTVKSAPRVLATAWDAFRQQGGAFGRAHAAGSFLGMTSAAVQMALLALPALGLVFMLGNLARRGFGALWAWSRPTPARRAVGALGTVAAVALVGFLWAPQLPFGHGRPGPLYPGTRASLAPIRADERGTLGDAARGLVAAGAPPTATPVSGPAGAPGGPTATPATPARGPATPARAPGAAPVPIGGAALT
ncbi:MAG TPA: hypothetical protein VFL91_30565, partial [Thermomicrobiales bacterium]|nr:hypothetical protein [Thermomicrobiales bacterium]